MLAVGHEAVQSQFRDAGQRRYPEISIAVFSQRPDALFRHAVRSLVAAKPASIELEQPSIRSNPDPAVGRREQRGRADLPLLQGNPLGRHAACRRSIAAPQSSRVSTSSRGTDTEQSTVIGHPDASIDGAHEFSRRGLRSARGNFEEQRAIVGEHAN